MSGVPGMRTTASRKGTGIDWAVAAVVHDTATGGIGLLELSEHMGDVPKATLSRAVRRLEAAQVVRVQVDRSDRRRIVISPGPVSAATVRQPNISSHVAQARVAS